MEGAREGCAQRGRRRGSHDEAEAAGREFVLVQAHHYALHVAALGEDLRKGREVPRPAACGVGGWCAAACACLRLPLAPLLAASSAALRRPQLHPVAHATPFKAPKQGSIKACAHASRAPYLSTPPHSPAHAPSAQRSRRGRPSSPSARLVDLVLRGEEGQVAHVHGGARAQPLLKLLLVAVKAAVAVVGDDLRLYARTQGGRGGVRLRGVRGREPSGACP